MTLYSVSIRACNRYYLFRSIPIYSDLMAATLQYQGANHISY
nr:MAG TPA: hypothetical protein [Caudoviricetes sp.]